MSFWRFLFVASLITTIMASPAAAQDDAESEPAATRRIAPEECVSEPQVCEEIAAILELDGEGVPAPERTQITPPFGELADMTTATAVAAAAREIIACFNAGDIPRGAALMTDNGVRRAYWGLTIDEENRELAMVRIPAPPERRADEFLIRLTAVTNVTMLPDGRAAAFVVISEPLLPPGGAETLLFIFADREGRWLLDDLIDFSVLPLPPAEDVAPEA